MLLNLCAAVRSVKDLSPTWPGKDLDQWGFRPDFTHQLFDEERIVGYREGDVAVHLVYTAASLHFLVKIRTSDGDVKMWVLGRCVRTEWGELLPFFLLRSF